MDAQVVIHACAQLEQGPHASSESTLLALRSLANPYALCLQLLQSEAPLVQFHAASTIKEAFLRERGGLGKDTLDHLRKELLRLTLQKFHSLQPFVRKQLLHVQALVFKHCCDAQPASYLPAFLTEVQQALMVADKIPGLAFLQATVEEMDAPSSFLTVAANNLVHRQFQAECLPSLASLLGSLLQALLAFLGQSSQQRPLELATVAPVCSALNSVVGWQFEEEADGLLSSVRQLVRRPSRYDEVIRLTPPACWSPVLVKSPLLEVCMSAYLRFRTELPEASCHLSEVLLSLASLHGSVFPLSEQPAVGEWFVSRLCTALSPCLQTPMLSLQNKGSHNWRAEEEGGEFDASTLD